MVRVNELKVGADYLITFKQSGNVFTVLNNALFYDVGQVIHGKFHFKESARNQAAFDVERPYNTFLYVPLEKVTIEEIVEFDEVFLREQEALHGCNQDGSWWYKVNGRIIVIDAISARDYPYQEQDWADYCV